jgi:hypothetical protein
LGQRASRIQTNPDVNKPGLDGSSSSRSGTSTSAYYESRPPGSVENDNLTSRRCEPLRWIMSAVWHRLRRTRPLASLSRAHEQPQKSVSLPASAKTSRPTVTPDKMLVWISLTSIRLDSIRLDTPRRSSPRRSSPTAHHQVMLTRIGSVSCAASRSKLNVGRRVSVAARVGQRPVAYERF